jgi:2-haloacid dehalogenase
MPSRPLVVAFDIIETTISLEPLRAIFIEAGLPDASLEHWFSIGLRDAFALGAAGDYKPFITILTSAVEELFAVHGLKPTRGFAPAVEAAMQTLPAQPGAVEAFRILHERGVRIFALTNGSHASTTKLLESNDLLDMVEEVISIDQIGAPKPQPQVYRYLLERAGAAAEHTALVATHGWDLNGAAPVGLTTAFVRHRKPFSEALRSPDVEASSLPRLAQALIDLS